MYRDHLNNPSEEAKRQINGNGKDIKTIIKHYKEHKWTTVCNEINEQQGKKYWQQIKKLSKYKQTPQIPQLEKNGQKFETDEEKAAIFADHFRDAFIEDNSPQFDNIHYELVPWHETYFSNTPNIGNRQIDEDAYFKIVYKGKRSQASFITEEAAQMLALPRERIKAEISGLADGKPKLSKWRIQAHLQT
ncbi:unnamed protein product [Psylliodes chrysocephalus]|uniref:Uncharacterized protein n=1 Tax=Psylliodes chrysocephalus TaxID=3402493 RepID=A0A9P0GC57_9CUCU|nr:unnamed protein product [Psylliodes chrysocephala]